MNFREIFEVYLNFREILVEYLNLIQPFIARGISQL